MKLANLLAGIEAGLSGVAATVAAMHPEDALEGEKLAAGAQLVQFMVGGMLQIANAYNAARATPAPAPAATVAATPSDPVLITPGAGTLPAPVAQVQLAAESA